MPGIPFCNDPVSMIASPKMPSSAPTENSGSPKRLAALNLANSGKHVSPQPETNAKSGGRNRTARDGLNSG